MSFLDSSAVAFEEENFTHYEKWPRVVPSELKIGDKIQCDIVSFTRTNNFDDKVTARLHSIYNECGIFQGKIYTIAGIVFDQILGEPYWINLEGQSYQCYSPLHFTRPL